MHEGRTIGSLRLIRELGRGGMGVVYLAEHVVLKAPRVVKLLSPEWAWHPESHGRFVNEAVAASSLDNDNIVKVFDCLQTPEGEWLIVMEYLDGNPLSKLMQSTGGPMPLSTIVQIIGQACYALHDAHEHDIVHRDVKPDNIFLIQKPGNDHFVKVLDFGIAKRGGADVRTRTGSVMGTPTYMAPEQLRDSKDITRACDIYSLGVVIYEMATGRRLWDGVTAPAAIYDLQKHSPRPDPRAVRAELPPALAEVISIALAFDPADRWQTAPDLARALAHKTPGTDWTESGIEILRRFAAPLLTVDAEASTAGQPLPSMPPHAYPILAVPAVPPVHMVRAPTEPTLRPGLLREGGGHPSSVPIVTVPTVVSTPEVPRVVPMAIGTPVGVHPLPADQPTIAASPRGGGAGPRVERRGLLWLAVTITAAVVLVSVIVLATRGDGGERDRAGAPAADAAMPIAAPPDGRPAEVAAPEAAIDPPEATSTPRDAGIPTRPHKPRARRDAGAASGTGAGRVLDPDDVIGN